MENAKLNHEDYELKQENGDIVSPWGKGGYTVRGLRVRPCVEVRERERAGDHESSLVTMIIDSGQRENNKKRLTRKRQCYQG
jgi:hypothetical protein